MLILENITFGFGTSPPLVSNLNLTVKPGEMGLVQGASGIGKSTLLSIIAGLPVQDLRWSGRVYLNDTDISQMPAQSRHVGLMF